MDLCRNWELRSGIFWFLRFSLLGKSVANPLGIRIAAVAALLFCILGLYLYTRLLTEKGVMKILKTKEQIE